jgi:mRNA interferase HigB
MKVHLIAVKTIRNYSRFNPQSFQSINNWIENLKKADWSNPEEIQDLFPSADLLGRGSSRVVFDLGGNKYRMICSYAFGEREVKLYICWIGTHKEYDILCRKNKQYTISEY